MPGVMSTILGLVQLVLFIGLIAGAAWVIRRVHVDDTAGWGLRITLVLVGLVSGVALCFVRYMPRDDLAVFGVPLPLAIFQREEGHWVDYVGPPVAMLFIGVLNVVLLSAVSHAVGLVLLWRRGRVQNGLAVGR